MLRKLFFAAIIIFCFSYISGCDKNIKDKPATAVSDQDATAFYRNPFGDRISESNGFYLAPAEAASYARELGVAYARISVGNLQWAVAKSRNRFLDEYNQYANGVPSIKLVINVAWGSSGAGPIPFPGATPEYKAFIKDLTDTLSSGRYRRPACLMIEDEENNPGNHIMNTSADWQKYIDMLTFATEECHSKNLPVANGGLSLLGSVLLIWDYYENKLNDTARAALFLSQAMPPAEIKKFNNHKYVHKREIMTFFANAYKTIPFDYINIHWYEPVKLSFWSSPVRATDIDTTALSPGVLESAFEYYNDPDNLGGKQLICNEAGMMTPANEIPQLLTCALQGLPIVVWSDGDRGEIVSQRPYQQYALHTTVNGNPPSYIIRPNGLAFKENILNIRAQPFVFCQPITGFKPAVTLPK